MSLDRSQDRFWGHLGSILASQNRSKIHFSWPHTGFQTHPHICVLGGTAFLHKISQHSLNISSTGPPKWSQVGPKLVPKSIRFFPKAPSGPMDVDGSASEPILVRFWIDLGWVFGRCLLLAVDLGPIFASIFVHRVFHFWVAFDTAFSLFLFPMARSIYTRNPSGWRWPVIGTHCHHLPLTSPLPMF